MTDEMIGFAFQISQALKMLQRWFIPQNKLYDSMFQMRQTLTVMACMWRNRLKIMM